MADEFRVSTAGPVHVIRLLMPETLDSANSTG